MLLTEADEEALEERDLARSGERVRPLVGSSPCPPPDLRALVGLVWSANLIELPPVEGVGEGG